MDGAAGEGDSNWNFAFFYRTDRQEDVRLLSQGGHEKFN
jgi:hypothetical protein